MNNSPFHDIARDTGIEVGWGPFAEHCDSGSISPSRAIKRSAQSSGDSFPESGTQVG